MSVTDLDPAVRRTVLDLAQDPHDPKGYRCAGCRRKFSLSAVEIDHIIPECESRPGDRTDPDNLQVLCNPKGSTRLTSCHKRKTAMEAADRAKRNKVPKDWLRIGGFGGLAVMSCGYTYFTYFPTDLLSRTNWLAGSAVVYLASLSTILVKNGWESRSPREVIPAGPEGEPEPGLDTERIIEAVRTLVGKAGEVAVIDIDGLDAFTITYEGTGFPDHDDEKRLELVLKVSAKVGDRWKAVWDTESDQVRFTRRPPLPKLLPHPGFTSKDVWHKIRISDDVVMDLQLIPHWLIIGKTGMGKTTTLHTIVSHGQATKMEVRLADPKRVELKRYRGQVHTLATKEQDLWDFTLDLLAEMEERYRLFEEEDVPLESHTPILAVIDEYEEYVRRMNAKWLTDRKKTGPNPCTEAAASLLSLARKCLIFLVIGTQRPDSKWFGGAARDNCGGRMAVGPISGQAAGMVFEDRSAGRDVPASARGRLTVQLEDGDPFESQAYYLAG